MAVFGHSPIWRQIHIRREPASRTLNNGLVQATFQLTPKAISSLSPLPTWPAATSGRASLSLPSSLIHLQAGSDVFDANRQFLLLDQYTGPQSQRRRQYIVLQDMNGAAQITVNLDVYDNQPVLRYSVSYRNLQRRRCLSPSVDMLPLDVRRQWASATPHCSVNQWSVDHASRPISSRLRPLLDPGGTAVEVYSGAHGQHCGWLAVRDNNLRGLFAGWEFDGRTKTTVLQQASTGYLQFSASMLDLNHPVAPDGDFSGAVGIYRSLPWRLRRSRLSHAAFHGIGAGEARARPRNISRTSRGIPGPTQGNINEHILNQNAEHRGVPGCGTFHCGSGLGAGASATGTRIPTKFPTDWRRSRLCTLAGHEVRPAFRADRSRPGQSGAAGQSRLDLYRERWLLRRHCHCAFPISPAGLAHPAGHPYHRRLWRRLDLQDGENMVKTCTKTTHTHDPTTATMPTRWRV